MDSKCNVHLEMYGLSIVLNRALIRETLLILPNYIQIVQLLLRDSFTFWYLYADTYDDDDDEFQEAIRRSLEEKWRCLKMGVPKHLPDFKEIEICSPFYKNIKNVLVIISVFQWHCKSWALSSSSSRVQNLL